MPRRIVLPVAVVAAFALAVYAAADRPAATADAPKPLPEMKFDDVAEIAPGVFFRYSSISATDPTIPFGGSNHAWVVFKDYVVVVDANFPKEAADVLAAIKKTTNKPIRYVLDTHHHGDHAYGNSVWAREGARIVAHKTAARLLKVNGPKQWEDASKDREDLRKTELKQADVTFDDPYVLDDGTQRVEFRHFGHSHTAGDAVAYLPKLKILCTGDACVNGSFNYMGHSNTASWIKCLEGMEKLDVDVVGPGHGKLARKDLLATQKRYFADLRAEVKKGLDAKKSLDEIAAGIDLPWYKEWTGKAAKENKDNVKHVYDELTGKVDHDRLGAAPPPLDWRAEPRGFVGR
ncbi:MAG: MBL fold metallo-hydrolase [Gemmataceae bacterium]|nr:MBL fold metallo-hydrolase [Gemmataceae bacterium]